MKPIRAINTLLICALLAFASPAPAQDETVNMEQLRAELEAARAELAEAARRMARLQRQLVEREVEREVERGAVADDVGRWISESPDGTRVEEIVIGEPMIVDGNVRIRSAGNTPRLGILVGRDHAGPEILGVTPGGGAEAAGLQRGDRVLAVNGVEIGEGSTTIREALNGVEAGSTVSVAVERDGERLELDVKTSAPQDDIRVFARRFGDEEEDLAHIEALREGLQDVEREIIVLQDGERSIAPFRSRLPGLFVLGGNSDLVSNHEGLSPYFGTGDGVIVLRIDDDNPLRLEDGDVVLSIDGEPVARPVDLGRSMLERDPGETVLIEVMRDGTLVQLEGSVPESMMPRLRAAPGLGLHRLVPPSPPLAGRMEPPQAPAAPPVQR